MITLNPVALEKEINDRVMAARKDERKRVLELLLKFDDSRYMFQVIQDFKRELRKGGEP